MRRKSSISAKAFFTAFLLPVLSVYVLTVSCALGDVLDCCDDMWMSEVQAVHGSHDDHGHAEENGHDHGKAHQAAAGNHHSSSSEDDDCCNDLTTNFFSIFQAQHQVLIAAKANGSSLPHFTAPAAAMPDVFLRSTALTVYNGFKLPLKTNLSGAFLRILHQSFLN